MQSWLRAFVPPLVAWLSTLAWAWERPKSPMCGEPVYVPTDDERRMLDRALAELRGHPESGRSWDDVRGEQWPAE